MRTDNASNASWHQKYVFVFSDFNADSLLTPARCNIECFVASYLAPNVAIEVSDTYSFIYLVYS